MKKTLKLFTVITCIALVLALSSCGFWNKEQNDQVTTTTEPPHEHNFADADCLNPKTCECGATEGEALGHTPNNDDGDCTTAVTCSECGVVTTEARNEHTGGEATCGAKAVCESCGTAYGELDLENHVAIDGSCACGEIWHIDATEMTAEQLNAAVAEKLAAGETDIEIILAPDVPAKMFTAIRRALIDTEGVEDGSINLTLKGVTAIPDHSNDTDKYTLIFGVAYNDENGEFFDEEECVYQLASINLPDVLTIGERSFSHCENLTALIAPKAQMIDEWAFAYTGLLSVDLPEVTTIKYAAFIACEYITEFKLPKAAFLGDQALDMIIAESEVTFYLTNESDIVIDKDLWYGLNLEEEMIASANLVLHVNKQHQVNGNTWTAKDEDGNEVSFTFKSITFICSDGTTNHDYQYSDNGDGTHDVVCSKCTYVKVDNHNFVDGVCVCGKSGYVYDEATNTYTVYSNDFFQTAINDAKISGTAENPATVKLMADIEATGIPDQYGDVDYDVLFDNGVITLDLNGYTLTGTSSFVVIQVTNGASLTIDDSSENKSGKVVSLVNDVYTLYANGGNLVVNNGNFEGEFTVFGFLGGSIVINGGTFKATRYAVYPQKASLTITGGTFISDEYAAGLYNTNTATIMGGTFIGGKHDITTNLTQIFTYNENGEGPYFPGGLSTNDMNTLNNFLADGAAYYDAEGNKLTLADDATSYDGDITVRADN